MAISSPSPLPGIAYREAIFEAARRNGVDPRLLAAVAAQETGGPGSSSGSNIVGDGGHGRGLFQIDDRWHRFARTAAAMDPRQNSDYAAQMLAGLLRQYGGDVRKALSAYNAGSPNATGTVTQWPDGSRLSYADSVLRHYQQLGGANAAAPIVDPGTLHDLLAERNTAVVSLNALEGFRSSSGSAHAAAHSYRALAGLDERGHRRDGAMQTLIAMVGEDDSAAAKE